MSDYDCYYDLKFSYDSGTVGDYPDEYYDEAYDSWLDRQRLDNEED